MWDISIITVHKQDYFQEDYAASTIPHTALYCTLWSV